MLASQLFRRVFLVNVLLIIVAILATSAFSGSANSFRLAVLSLTLIPLGAAITFYAIRHFVRHLEQLTVVARQMAAGQSTPSLSTEGPQEIGPLSEAFQSMGRQLAGRIADLQEQRQRLQHNNQQLETVLAAMVEGVIAVDAQERVLLANNAALVLLESTRQAMIGRPIWEVVRQPRIEELVDQALQGTNPERLEFRVARTQSVISLAVSRLPGEPCPGAVLVLHDVTELRRLEQLRREFVANVSHELKTPLTSISAYTETLLDGAVDDAQHNRAFLRCIEEQADRLQGLIIDLLALARLDADDSSYEFSPFEIGPVLTASVKAHQAVAEAKRIHLSLHSPSEGLQVFADPDGIRTIIDNLLDNALNYTPAGGQVAVRWHSDGEGLQIEVADTGIGIAKEHQSRIFERFFRIDKARSRELGGTGLGLAIVKHLCQVFGGSVSVTSQMGQGSTFIVRLPQPAAGHRTRPMSDSTIGVLEDQGTPLMPHPTQPIS